MVEKCPCQTYVKSCCACVSMHCDECHGHSKFVQGRFCSNCGRPLKAELTPLYVPKSEVAELKAIIADHKANEERWQELYADTVDKWEKAYEELEIKLENEKAEVAREIFEEIERLISNECLVFKDENGIRGYVDASVHYAIAELKKKYTEEKK